jgi:ATP-binding protein involved in chromosome partitioning
MTNLNQQIISKISIYTLKNGKNLKDCISNIVIKNNDIGFAIDIQEACLNLKEAEMIRNEIITILQEIESIGKISIILTRNNINKPLSKNKQFIDGVKKVILVASGKGGVGKSTIAALIAQSLAKEHNQVGIVDADIYGPSIPQIFGINMMPNIIDKYMIPLIAHNVQIISIGFLTQDNAAIAWRGPMVSKAIYQLLSLTKWQDLDYLIIDMPPGTGDIHLSILENYQLYGIIMVTTPQKVASLDVTRAINLYRKFDLPILGLIENMSYFVDGNGERLQIFSGGSGAALSREHNIDFLYHIPILSSLSQACDNGTNLADIVSLPLEKLIK